jgi:hypothetical protein
MNPKDLDKNISVYDFDNHLPVPTHSYFKKTTGEDLMLELSIDAQKANAIMFKHAKDCMNILQASKLMPDRKVIEYLVATNESYRIDFVNYVCSYVASTLTIGDQALTEISKTNDPLDKLPQNAQNAIKSTNLGIKKFTDMLRYEVEVAYRKGY